MKLKMIQLSKKLLAVVESVIVLIPGLLFPRNESIWVFSSGYGESFSDNPKYLYLYCQNQSDIRNVWITKNKEVEETLSRNGFEAYYKRDIYAKYILLRAGVIYFTHRPLYISYTIGSQFVNLTHGNYLKHMGFDEDPGIIGDLQLKGLKLIEYISKNRILYTVTSSGNPIKVLKSAFNITDENILETGLARNDTLFQDINGEYINIDKRKFDCLSDDCNDKTSILWAPTHRRADRYGDDGKPLSVIFSDLYNLDEYLQDKSCQLFISPHPHSDVEVSHHNFDNIFMLPGDADIYPYLSEFDLMITDYSGIFYDYLLLDRPIIFHAPDRPEYQQTTGIYYHYQSHVPGPVTSSTTELKQAIGRAINDPSYYESDRHQLRSEYYAYVDGFSTKRIYENMAL